MIKVYTNNNLKKILEDKNITEYTPAYSGESVGLDLYATQKVDIQPATVLGGERGSTIATGLHIALPKSHAGLILERGSVTKTPLKVRAGVIDPGYTGEIFVNAVNVSDMTYIIKEGDKLPFQIVVVKCDHDFQVIEEDEYLEITKSSLRQSGQVGSSDKK
jgi:dUTP pyrophosphatase